LAILAKAEKSANSQSKFHSAQGILPFTADETSLKILTKFLVDDNHLWAFSDGFFLGLG
jgi:hypothetical protein